MCFKMNSKNTAKLFVVIVVMLFAAQTVFAETDNGITTIFGYLIENPQMTVLSTVQSHKITSALKSEIIDKKSNDKVVVLLEVEDVKSIGLLNMITSSSENAKKIGIEKLKTMPLYFIAPDDSMIEGKPYVTKQFENGDVLIVTSKNPSTFDDWPDPCSYNYFLKYLGLK